MVIENNEIRDKNTLIEMKELSKNMNMFQNVIERGYGEYNLYKFVTEDTIKMIVDLSISAIDSIDKTSALKGYEKKRLYRQVSKTIDEFKEKTRINFSSKEIANKIVTVLD